MDEAAQALDLIKNKYHTFYWNWKYPIYMLKKYYTSEQHANQIITQSISSNPGFMGLYIHIPICASKCRFCHINVFINEEGVIEKYFKLLQDEIDTKNINRSFDYLSIGGGTPTLLSAEELERLLRMFDKYSFKKDAKKAIETTLEAIDEGKIKVLKNNGFDRISIGIQSFDNSVLKRYNKRIDIDKLIYISKIIKQYNISLNIDLILGLTQEDENMIDEFIDNIKIIDPDQVCFTEFYTESTCLSEHERHVVENTLKSNHRLYQDLTARLKSLGYIRMHGRKSGFYFTKSNELHTPNHNINNMYLYFGNVVGFGPEAQSHYRLPNGNLLTTSNSMKLWKENRHGFMAIEIPPHEHIRKHLMYNFGLSGKILSKSYKEYFGDDFLVRFKDIFEPLIRDDIITVKENDIIINDYDSRFKNQQENSFRFCYKYIYSDDMRSAFKH